MLYFTSYKGLELANCLAYLQDTLRKLLLLNPRHIHILSQRSCVSSHGDVVLRWLRKGKAGNGLQQKNVRGRAWPRLFGQLPGQLNCACCSILRTSRQKYENCELTSGSRTPPCLHSNGSISHKKSGVSNSQRPSLPDVVTSKKGPVCSAKARSPSKYPKYSIPINICD